LIWAAKLLNKQSLKSY